MKKVKSAFQICNNKIVYVSKTFEEDIQALKKHEDAWGEVIFEIVDRAAHFQFKYYFGFLLPDIADALGEKDVNYVDQFILKPKFLFRPVKDWIDIPTKYANKCRVIIEDDVVTGYIPSKAALKYDEMKAFLEECENFLTYGLNGCIGQHDNLKSQEEAMQTRELAGFNGVQGDLFQ